MNIIQNQSTYIVIILIKTLIPLNKTILLSSQSRQKHMSSLLVAAQCGRDS